MDHPAHFENVTGRGHVGHSRDYTREQIIDKVNAYLDTHDHITRRDMMHEFGLTEYKACQWLDMLTEMPQALLITEKIGKTYVYKRRMA